jgi:hypothetical protein
VGELNFSSFLAYRNHRLQRETPPTLVLLPHYSTVRLSSSLTILSLSAASKRISTHFGGDRFEHGLIIKSYASDLISMTVSCMPFESFCLFLESCHPTLMASRFSFPKPLEWHFDEGDTVSYIVDSDDGTSYHKSGVISMLRSDAVELSTEEGTVCVPWLKIRRVIHQGDFVEVTGGMYLGCRGWVGELQDQTGSLGDHLRFTGQVANIIKIEDKDKPLSDRTQVFPVPIPNECSCAHLPLRCLTYPSIY